VALATFGRGQFCTILRTLSRPPVVVIPESAGTGSTLSSSSNFSSCVVRVHIETASSAAPDTCAVAIEVPCWMP
jgi:hypothetical protein